MKRGYPLLPNFSVPVCFIAVAEEEINSGRIVVANVIEILEIFFFFIIFFSYYLSLSLSRFYCYLLKFFVKSSLCWFGCALCFVVQMNFSRCFVTLKLAKSPSAWLGPSAVEPLLTPPVYRTLRRGGFRAISEQLSFTSFCSL